MFIKALEGRDRFVESVIGEKAQQFLDASDNYKTFSCIRSVGNTDKFLSIGVRVPIGNFWQLVMAIVAAVVAGYLVKDLIVLGENQGEITVGFALLRISILIIPSYFAFFFTRLFLTGRKLYEFYRFKGIALTTLAHLYKVYPNEQKEVMAKAVSVIFSEFKDGDGGEVTQKDLLNFVSSIAKNN